MPMLRLEMLPARQGDCLWVTYGPASAPDHLVIDGGPEKARVLLSEVRRRLEDGRRLHIDLLVVTHVDNDHIGGVLELLEQFPDGLTVNEVWFNAYRHLLPADRLGADQGERLSAVLDQLVSRGKLKWNAAFDGGPVAIPDSGELPRFKRKHGLTLTPLSPDRAQLAALEKVWKVVVKQEEGESDEKEEQEDLLGRRDPWPPDIAKLAKMSFKPDKKEANGSSIALIAEYGGKRLLLAGDAFPARIVASLDRFNADERLKLDAYKLSHHGSKKSNSSELLRRVACSQYLISSNGSYFGHPDAEAMARVLVHGGKNPMLTFNSNLDFARRWSKKASLRGAPAFRTRYPEGAEGIAIDFE
jgi:beta-lactamase superfamily II metal-dependent hydrolase